MNPKGYELVVSALEDASDIGSFNVLQVPQEGQDLPIVSIEAEISRPFVVIGALKKANLIRDMRVVVPPVPDAPSLMWFGDDKRVKGGRYRVDFWDANTEAGKLHIDAQRLY
jgi:hypothetical protein